MFKKVQREKNEAYVLDLSFIETKIEERRKDFFPRFSPDKT